MVIGAGLGALAFAGYMAKNGFKVLVLEQHDIPGGYATTFTRKGGRFTFDVSLHQTAMSGSMKTMLKDLGVLDKVKFHKGKNLFRLITPNVDFTCPGGDPEKFESLLKEMFPKEKEGIHGFLKDMLDLNGEVQEFFQAGKLSLIGKITFPFRYPCMWGARNKSLEDYLNQHVSDPRVRSVLSVFCGYYGLPPDQLSGFYYMNASASYLKYGGSYPQGCSTAISQAVVDFIESKGGEVRTGKRVDKVLMKDRAAVGVRTTDGEEFRAAAVVANCSAVTLFNKMFSPRALPESFRKKIRPLKPSVSSFIVWLALNQDITDRVKDSHIFLETESDPNKAFQYCLEGRADMAPIGVCIYNNMYKDYSPPGTTVLSLVFTAGYEPWKPFEKDYFAGRRQDYHKKKQQITRTLIQRVEEKLIPGLSGMIEVQEAGTPLTNVRYTLNTQGAIYGFEQSLDNTFMNRLSNRTPIKNLYLAGAWGEPGGGYTAVLLSGKKTFGMLMEDWA